jgi:predicted nucleic acid-binding protein
MRAVVDTNVVAYYLLGNPQFGAEAREFWKSLREPLAPALWEAELANVVWMSVRLGVLPSVEGTAKLRLARHLGIHTVATRALWHGALLRSVETGIAVYDTLFVELAEREQAPLVTFDRRLLEGWPALARRPAELGARS